MFLLARFFSPTTLKWYPRCLWKGLLESQLDLVLVCHWGYLPPFHPIRTPVFDLPFLQYTKDKKRPCRVPCEIYYVVVPQSLDLTFKKREQSVTLLIPKNCKNWYPVSDSKGKKSIHCNKTEMACLNKKINCTVDKVDHVYSKGICAKC